jgi:molecular chaperone GrpE
MSKKNKKVELEEVVETATCCDEQGSCQCAEETTVESVDYKDQYLRLFAEFDNFRKRTMRERVELISSASRDVMTLMIPLIDDFERAESNPSEDVEVMREGMTLIQSKMITSLTSNGLKPMDIKSGDDFNTDYHEAITSVPAPKPALKGKIVDVVEKGYMLGDKVLRYAKVVIGK